MPERVGATPAAAIFFDLDGTLADTAPDLGGVANELRAARGLAPLPIAQLRPHASKGVRGLLGAAFGLTPQDVEYARLAETFLARYAQRLARETTLFDGMAALLAGIEARGLRWGVVTNKAERLAWPLLAELGVVERCSVLVGGDTAARPKPAPDPLLLAARTLGFAPAACWFVGDDLRDVQAGRAAGMPTVAAAYGYIDPESPLENWRADHIIQSPTELLRLLDQAG
jgi:phosphoglycolate phosphatase